MTFKVRDIIFIIIITSIPLLFINFYSNRNNYSADNEDFINKNNIKTKNLLNIPADSFFIVKEKINYNQHIASIFSGYNVNSFSQEDIIRKTQNVFDIRKIRAGNYYTAYLSKDTIKELKYFVYQHSLTEYLKISMIDSILVELIKPKVDTIQKSASGTIQTSLWETMVENNVNPSLALELSEIYAWSIDFFGLQKGDHFKVIYDELYIDTISIGIGKIYAANFNHQQVDYFGFNFKRDDQLGFYDENGNSLRKAFLKAPLKYNRISSRFSYNRFHPILKIWRPHSGVDYAAPTGTPIHSIGEGIIIARGYTKSAGYYIKIKHNGVYTSGYNHLSKYASGMKVGRKVNQGQVIGYVGSTGYATGPHLDFRIWKNGKLTDPLKIKAPPIEPVNEENMEKFTKIKNLMMGLLNSV